MFRKLISLVKAFQKFLDLSSVYWEMKKLEHRMPVKVSALVTLGR